MKRLMNILFLSCFKATELIEKKLLFRLSKKESVQLTVHKAMCDACKLYEKQSVLIDKSLQLHLESKQGLENKKLKTKILKKLEES